MTRLESWVFADHAERRAQHGDADVAREGLACDARGLEGRPPRLEVTLCDFEFVNLREVTRNMKPAEKLTRSR